MIVWWESLTITEQIFAIVAVPSTVILLIQTVMLLFGFGGHDASSDSDVSGLDGSIGDAADAGSATDFDTSFDAHTDMQFDSHDHTGQADQHDHDDGHADPGLRLFTVRGLVAFFTIFGWTGLVCLQAGVGKSATFVIAFIAGAISMTVMAWILKVSMKLAFNGTTNLANAVGKTATVYIRVPQLRSARGKVNVLVQEQYIEADAVTDEPFDLKPGSEVLVVGLSTPATLLVMARKQNRAERINDK